ncbi:FMN-dependent NADH-azoreductase [Pleionea litopenaei]|uniref:FMN dependent NADH:quinone oxidoreductase n=1 Tax=Pleionea litopenaei TaxID=3070815 RepID=A0AA51X6I0_9GAMM|nr:NAD(P)H-dependent oxidoreductase [Pleionea sp. HL-JVS1]WMS86110.1 NAD(P)H-dependent oxidoreductase [Pleionea sp. HL-JVS1]
MNILHIESSIFAENGVSSQLSRTLLEKLTLENPGSEIRHKHFGQEPVPHFDGETLQALMQDPDSRSGEQKDKVAYADQQIADVQWADVIVIGLPMYNFSVPSMLKAWFDFIARAGVTFRYTEKGPEGLLLNKKVHILATRGGQYKDTPIDTQIPFVKTFLNFLGITDINVIYAEGLNMGDDLKTLAIADAENQIQQLQSA